MQSPPGIDGGPVALVFTDVERSTSLWERVPDAMRVALAMHDATLRDLLTDHDGYEVKTEGDAFMVAFRTAEQALGWCLDLQLALVAASWPPDLLGQASAAEEHGMAGLRVRCGVHIGQPDCQRNPITDRMDYFGPVVNRAARVARAAHGGQILVSGTAWATMTAPDQVTVSDLGHHLLEGLGTVERLVHVLPRALSERSFPGPRVGTTHLPLDEAAATGAEELDDALEQIAVRLLARGEVNRRRDRVDDARADLEAAAGCAQRAGARGIEGRVYAGLGSLEVALGRLDAARLAFERSLQAAGEARDLWTEGEAIAGLGAVAAKGGNPEPARQYFEKALVIHRRTDNRRGEARVLGNLGITWSHRGDRDRAETNYRSALAIHEELGNTRLANIVRNNLGVLAMETGSGEARGILLPVLERARQLGDRRSEGLVLSNLGMIFLDAGDADSAQRVFRQARDAFLDLGARWNIALVAVQQGLADHMRGNLPDAITHLRQGIVVLEQMGEKRVRGYGLAYLGAALADADDPEARFVLELASRIAREVDDTLLHGAIAVATAHLDGSISAAREIDSSRSVTLRVMQRMLPTQQS
jgi:class 3 adenylate cyclase/tetratricopeptide (TPR) repeat protein